MPLRSVNAVTKKWEIFLFFVCDLQLLFHVCAWCGVRSRILVNEERGRKKCRIGKKCVFVFNFFYGSGFYRIYDGNQRTERIELLTKTFAYLNST